MVSTQQSMIQISVKGLAKFMHSAPATQRKVLRDFKYPDPEGAAQAKYYREARKTIVAYHQGDHDSGWLIRKADQLDLRGSHQGGRSEVRLRNNARGLRHYAKALGDKDYEVLADLRLDVEYGPVRIKVTPELHVVEKGKEKIIKLDFAKPTPDPRLVKTITQVMFEAAEQNSLPIAPSGILYIDVTRGKIHKGARIGARLSKDIEAACQNMAAIWERL